ncbi:MAG: hypothetical protein DIZ80_11125 [endosymbiont of Galathealinum brachiosum]|uniref:Uncharacterized protein n=1 Tax=endosymbiont of Galathealinum brachiosum TaxID=2200906 RepID=A0A370DF64_9GAMM|nr:MAG: hypothetical protein DIZ80_11125 [endosymbiont of Galathealinum brachiosum]
MKFCIRVWSENTVVLMTEAGHVLSYFNSVKEALDACSQWYDCNASELKHNVAIQYKQVGLESSSVMAYA